MAVQGMMKMMFCMNRIKSEYKKIINSIIALKFHRQQKWKPLKIWSQNKFIWMKSWYKLIKIKLTFYKVYSLDNGKMNKCHKRIVRKDQLIKSLKT